jgi:hypothetical protein
MYYTPYFEPIFQDKRAPGTSTDVRPPHELSHVIRETGLGNAHKYWTKVSTLLFLQSELAPTGDLERSSPISWEYEGGDSEHGRGRQLQRNLQWVIEIALEQLSHVLSATEVEVLKRFAANTRPLESVGILKPSLWFRDSCTYSDQESKCAHPTPFAGVARRLEYTSSKTLCLELGMKRCDTLLYLSGLLLHRTRIGCSSTRRCDSTCESLYTVLFNHSLQMADEERGCKCLTPARTRGSTTAAISSCTSNDIKTTILCCFSCPDPDFAMD